ncbi:capsule biosynthesis protein [Shewanella sp. VB17]|uniref:capsule biosynthesis protein n=1 Tax=Shewanella sp. VB17 TaxID=2739432 RepID=UPI0020B691CA|nr:capsular biosynthesis protein [Shewanella sp. VB17]
MSNILFLQGPLGPFFKKLAHHCASLGHYSHKINFNGGDRYYGGADNQLNYLGSPEHWHQFLTQFCIENSIDSVVVYGDCRFYHKVAKQVSVELNVDFWAFEEGYLRAGFVTLEQGGCNANSPLFNNMDNLQSIEAKETNSSHPVSSTFGRRARYATCYYIWRSVRQIHFFHYRHHRPWGVIEEAYYWVKSFGQKWHARLLDPARYKAFIEKYDQQFFLLPLQVEVDFQLRDHSHFNSVEQVIDEVLRSFADNAAQEQGLLIKHHPQNRGFEHYGVFIDKLVDELSLQGRVLYGHDFNLPDVYHHAKGVVTVNSTVGISALLHKLPTIVLGKALYNIAGLTYQGGLAQFWQSIMNVDGNLFAQFRTHLCDKTQVEGDFYKDSESLIVSACQKINHGSAQP